MKKNWGTFTKFWLILSIVVGVLALLGVGGMLVRIFSLRSNPNINLELYNKALMLLGAAAVIVVLGLAATVWLMRSKSPKALYSVIALDVVNSLISLVNGQVSQAIGGIAGAVIIWLLCRKVVFDLE